MSLTILIVAGAAVLTNIAAWAFFGFWHWRWARTVRWHGDLMPDALPLEAGEGKTALLFVHGFNDVPYVWKRIVGEFAERGYYARAMRVPGAGEEHCRASLASMRSAIDAEVENLKASHQRVVLIGHSMGGALSIDAVLRGVALPDKLVLLAPLVEVSRRRSPVFSAFTYYRILRIMLPALRWVPSVFKEYLAAEDDPEFVYHRDKFNEIGWYRALFGLVTVLRNADRSGWRVPTLAYTGGDDSVVDSAATRKWFQSVPCAEVRELAGAKHVIPLQHGWRNLVAEIDEFIGD